MLFRALRTCLPPGGSCEGACILTRKGKPINIGALERYASDALAAAEARSSARHKPDRFQSSHDRFWPCQPELRW